MVFSFSGGAVPQNSPRPHPQIIEPDGFDFRNIKFADYSEAASAESGPLGEAYSSGFSVDTEYLLKKICLNDTTHLLDFDMVAGALQIVSCRARDLIEQFEPGVHQFESVEYVRADGKHVADMFAIFIRRRLDTVDRAHTNMLLSPHRWTSARVLARIKPHLVPPDVDLQSPPKLVFNEGQIGSAHLWRDKHLAERQFMSEALVQAIDSAGYTGLGRSKEESVP